MADPIPMRLHQHFKGPDKKYTVLCVAFDVNPPYTERVVYMPHYGENVGVLLTRELKEWKEDVDRELDDGSRYTGPRFWPLPPAIPSFARRPQN